MSPKTLATVFEYCLNQEDTPQSLVPHYEPSSELPLTHDGNALPIRKANTKSEFDEGVLPKLADKRNDSETKGDESRILQQQETRETPTEVLLAEDHLVNLKVGKTAPKPLITAD